MFRGALLVRPERFNKAGRARGGRSSRLLHRGTSRERRGARRRRGPNPYNIERDTDEEEDSRWLRRRCAPPLAPTFSSYIAHLRMLTHATHPALQALLGKPATLGGRTSTRSGSRTARLVRDAARRLEARAPGGPTQPTSPRRRRPLPQVVRAGDAKDILFGNASRSKMQDGINKIADAVASTLGPRGASPSAAPAAPCRRGRIGCRPDTRIGPGGPPSRRRRRRRRSTLDAHPD